MYTIIFSNINLIDENKDWIVNKERQIVYRF